MPNETQATMSFICPSCGQNGAAWGAYDGVNRVEVSSGFHLETDRADDSEPLVVCDRCDEIQPEAGLPVPAPHGV
jgi:hypothetical protein